MATIINKEGILSLAKILLDSCPGHLHEPEEWLLHLGDSFDIGGETVKRITHRYPGLKEHLNEEEGSVSSGLHDIGRVFRKNQLFHELEGARFVEKHGLGLVAESLADVYRLAQMFRPHYVVAEQWADDENKAERAKFEPLDSRLLIPRTWQEAIVVYSELSNMRGERVPVQKRVEDVRKRYSTDPKYMNSSPSVVRAMEKGLPRVLETCEMVQRLRNGELEMHEIMRYGFL